MIEKLKHMIDFIDRIIKYVAITAFGVMAVLIILQVFFRYVLGASLSFSEELARFLFIWSTMLGTAMCLKRHSHIGFDLLMEYLPARVKKYVGLITGLLGMLFYATIMIFGLRVVGITMSQTSPAIGVPMGYIYLSIPVAGAIMILNGLFNILEDWRKITKFQADAAQSGSNAEGVVE